MLVTLDQDRHWLPFGSPSWSKKPFRGLVPERIRGVGSSISSRKRVPTGPCAFVDPVPSTSGGGSLGERLCRAIAWGCVIGGQKRSPNEGISAETIKSLGNRKTTNETKSLPWKVDFNGKWMVFKVLSLLRARNRALALERRMLS